MASSSRHPRLTSPTLRLVSSVTAPSPHSDSRRKLWRAACARQLGAPDRPRLFAAVRRLRRRDAAIIGRRQKAARSPPPINLRPPLPIINPYIGSDTSAPDADIRNALPRPVSASTARVFMRWRAFRLCRRPLIAGDLYAGVRRGGDTGAAHSAGLVTTADAARVYGAGRHL